MPLGAARISFLAKTAEAAAAGRTPTSWTANGNVTMSTGQKKFGRTSANFDGSGDYLTSTDITSLATTDDFTWECWFYMGSLPSTRYTLGESHGYIQIQNVGGGDYDFATALRTSGGTTTYQRWDLVSTATSTWHHVAFVKQGSSWQVYQNGTACNLAATSGTVDSTRGWNNSGSEEFIGRLGATTTYDMNGYIDEVRLSNTARYTTAFTPSATAFENDANTLYLLHMDGYNNNFIDDVGIGVRLGATAWTYDPDSPASVGAGKISNSYKWTGSGAPNYSGVAIGYGRDGKGYIEDTEEWTLEFWLRKDNDGNRGMTYFSTGSSNFSYNTLSTSDFTLYDDDGSYKFRWPNNTQSNVSSLSDNVWYHFAIVCDGSGNVTVYRDGSVYTSKTGLSWTAKSVVYFGCGYGTNATLLSGNFAEFDEIRHSSTQRYTTSFTPETTAFSDDANTYGLLHCDASPETDDIADSY